MGVRWSVASDVRLGINDTRSKSTGGTSEQGLMLRGSSHR